MLPLMKDATEVANNTWRDEVSHIHQRFHELQRA